MPSIILRNIRKRVRHKFMTHPLFVGINMLYDSCSISVINHNPVCQYLIIPIKLLGQKKIKAYHKNDL